MTTWNDLSKQNSYSFEWFLNLFCILLSYRSRSVALSPGTPVSPLTIHSWFDHTRFSFAFGLIFYCTTWPTILEHWIKYSIVCTLAYPNKFASVWLTKTLNVLLGAGSCTSEFQEKICAGLPITVGRARPNVLLQLILGLLFTFSCNSLVHDPDLGDCPKDISFHWQSFHCSTSNSTLLYPNQDCCNCLRRFLLGTQIH